MDDHSLNMSSGRSRAGRRTSETRTLVLTRADIVPLLSLSGYVDAVEAGFRGSATGAAHAPPPLHLAADEGGFHAKAAILVATDAHVAVKVNSNFPRNPASHALPTIQGSIALFDARDGRLLALMDSIEITLRRTAAASALAARFLARSDSATISKNEIKPELMRIAAVLVDVLDQCRTMGDLHHAIMAGVMTADDVRGDLAALVAGTMPWRRDRDEITLFDSTGTAIEDVAAAVAIYEQALRNGAGTPIALGAFAP